MSLRAILIGGLIALAVPAGLAMTGPALASSDQRSDRLPGADTILDKRAPASRRQIQLSFAPVVKRAAPAVVNVYSRRVVKQRSVSPLLNDPFFRRFLGNRGFGIPRNRVERSLGSGVIVRSDGVVITNNHVIRGGTNIEVVLNDGREFGAEIILADEKTDLAILKIDTDGEKLPFLEFDDSDTIEVGDLVLAIGNPFGVGQTVTSGIVSAQARTQEGISDFKFFIQTDAAINPGNSGGALIGLDGGLVGINTAIFSRSGGSNGIGFAIPSNMVRAVLESSSIGGGVKRPWVGAKLQDLTPAIADSLGLRTPLGALIQKLYPQSPLAAGGLRRGDVVLEIDGREVRKPQELSYRFATRRIGTVSEVVYWRDGERKTARIKMERPPDFPLAETDIKGRNPFAGARVANLSPVLAEQMNITYQNQGVVVLDVGPGPAKRVGFKRGDVILRVEETEIGDVDDLLEAIRHEHRVWSFSISRDGRVLNTRIEG